MNAVRFLRSITNTSVSGDCHLYLLTQDEKTLMGQITSVGSLTLAVLYQMLSSSIATWVFPVPISEPIAPLPALAILITSSTWNFLSWNFSPSVMLLLDLNSTGRVGALHVPTDVVDVDDLSCLVLGNLGCQRSRTVSPDVDQVMTTHRLVYPFLLRR